MIRLLRCLTTSLRAIDLRKEALLFGLFLAVALGFQWLGGVYQSEFGGHPDEPVHYVTGVFVRDAIARLPVCMAERSLKPLASFVSKDTPGGFYDHYPKVALGNWPPMFYLLQAVWTLLFSTSRTAVLLLMSVVAAFLAWLLCRALHHQVGHGAALLGGILLLSLPLVQEHTALVMTEIPVAIFCLAAALCWGRFLDRGGACDTVLFGLLASAAILTKGSGMALAWAVPVSVLLTGRFDRLKALAFWLPVPIVLVLAGPWTWKFREAARAGWEFDQPLWAFTSDALVYYPRKLFLAVGLALFLLALIGCLGPLRQSSLRQFRSGKWAMAAGLLFSVVLQQLIIPCGYEPRHLLPGLPPLLMFAVAGARMVIVWLKARNVAPQKAAALVWGIALAAYGLESLQVYHKGYAGFSNVAKSLLADPANSSARFLVSSDATGEGIFISEVVMRDKRPGHTIRRGSKALASSTWSGSGYRAKFDNAQEVIAFLEQESIEVLVLDESVPAGMRVAHHELLKQTVAQHPERFTSLGKHDMKRAGVLIPEAIRVYRFNSGASRAAPLAVCGRAPGEEPAARVALRPHEEPRQARIRR